MAWQTPTADDVLSEFTPSENATIATLLGTGPIDVTSKLSSILGRTVAEIRGFIQSGDYALDTDETTIPSSLMTDAVAITRWRLLISAPQLKQLQTAERQDAYKDSLAKLKLIAAQEFAVDPPAGSTVDRAGTWNSENKLIMRTHPTPKPAVQYSPQTNAYANPDAPADAVAQ